MSRAQSLLVRRTGGGAALAALLILGVAVAQAQTAASAADGPTGRIDFGPANLPPATVEVDLTQEMFSDFIGLGDAAVAGVAETLLQSAGANGDSAGLNMAAEQLEATRQILQIASEVVDEVRVRVYEKFADESDSAPDIAARFDDQLHADQWDSVVRIRDGKDSVQVSLVRSDNAVRGVFVVVSDGKDVVLANVVCDVSPENVKKLTAAATKIGLENGLGKVIEAKLKHRH
jgi:hypothetical protein